MNIHPALKPAALGAAVGALVMTIIGFSAFGWMLGSTAEKMAEERADAAAVGALAPLCVARFEAQADAATKLAELKKMSGSWAQRSFIEKGGWATMPGSEKPNSAVARVCADTLGKVT